MAKIKALGGSASGIPSAIDPSTDTIDGVAMVEVSKAGTLVGARKRINLIEGANVTITATDDNVNDEVDVTIAATGGGGGAVATDTIWDAKGDLAVGTAADTAAKLTVGADGLFLQAASGESTGLKYADPHIQALNAQTGTSYTLVLTDHTKLITLSNASAITLTVPPNSSVAFAVGSVIDLAQIGAGQVTVAQGSGVTINSTPGLKLRAQYSGATLRKRATDTWLLFGDLDV